MTNYYHQHIETALRGHCDGIGPHLRIPVEALKWLSDHDQLMPDWLVQMLIALFSEESKPPPKQRKPRKRVKKR